MWGVQTIHTEAPVEKGARLLEGRSQAVDARLRRADAITEAGRIAVKVHGRVLARLKNRLETDRDGADTIKVDIEAARDAVARDV